MQSKPPEMREFLPAAAFRSALDWWREAGVDYDFTDEPRSWLAEPETDEAVRALTPPAASKPVRTSPLQRALSTATSGPISDNLPDNLEKFRKWWMTEPSLAHGSLDRRVPPQGAEGAKLMVLVEQPARKQAGALLSTDEERLLGTIIRAMGLTDHETYIASALPTPMQLPEWGDLAARGMGSVARRHIALVKPDRVITFGRGQLALFNLAPDLARDPLTIECDGAVVPFLAAGELAQIARSPARRQRLWQRWLDWTE